MMNKNIIVVNEGDYIFTWKIDNFSSYHQKNGECIESPRFQIEYLCGVKWFLKLYPKGTTKAHKKFVSCFLAWEKSNETVKPISINFSFELLDESSRALYSSPVLTHAFCDNESDWGFQPMFAKNRLKEAMKSWQEDFLILQCLVKNNNTRGIQKALSSEACTSIDVNRCSVEWAIKIPTSFQFSENISFSFLNIHNFEINLTSFLDAMEIFVHFKEHPPELTRRISFKMGFFDKLGFKLPMKHAMKSFKSAGSWKFPHLITKKELESCKVGLSHYEFQLNCVIYTSKGSVSSKSTEHLTFKSSLIISDSLERKTSTLSMKNDFQSFYKSKKYSDITIRVGNAEVPAHKLVLQIRSPVFAAMFERDMLENRTSVVDITDIEEQTLGAFLEFLYLETVHKLDYEKAMKLLLIADKYQVLSLVDVCATYLTSVLSLDNVCEVIAIADLVNCESLKSCAFSFIKLNASKLLSTPYWLLWLEENAKLATYILSKLSTEFKFK